MSAADWASCPIGASWAVRNATAGAGAAVCPECREMRAYLNGHADAYELAMHETRNRAIGHADDRWIPMMQLADYFEHRATSTGEGASDWSCRGETS